MSSLTGAGICARKVGSRVLIASTTSTVLVPGWRWIGEHDAPRVPLNQLAILSFSTLSIDPARGRRGAPGEPLR